MTKEGRKVVDSDVGIGYMPLLRASLFGLNSEGLKSEGGKVFEDECMKVNVSMGKEVWGGVLID